MIFLPCVVHSLLFLCFVLYVYTLNVMTGPWGENLRFAVCRRSPHVSFKSFARERVA